MNFKVKKTKKITKEIQKKKKLQKIKIIEILFHLRQNKVLLSFYFLKIENLFSSIRAFFLHAFSVLKYSSAIN